MVRTPGFHPGNLGSIPGGDALLYYDLFNYFYSLLFASHLRFQAMKSFVNFYVLTLGILAISTTAGTGKITKKKTHRCRITYYCGDDKWGNRVADPATKRAVTGVTVAAHPDFPFGTKIFIPELKGHVGDGHFIVQDRGGWVTSKKAAQGKAYVFDVYVPTKREQNIHAAKRPMYMEVQILRD